MLGLDLRTERIHLSIHPSIHKTNIFLLNPFCVSGKGVLGVGDTAVSEADMVIPALMEFTFWRETDYKQTNV